MMEVSEVKKMLLESQEPRKVFCELMYLRQEQDLMIDLFDISCDNGHDFLRGPFRTIGGKIMFNVMMKKSQKPMKC